MDKLCGSQCDIKAVVNLFSAQYLEQAVPSFQVVLLADDLLPLDLQLHVELLHLLALVLQLLFELLQLLLQVTDLTEGQPTGDQSTKVRQTHSWNFP